MDNSDTAKSERPQPRTILGSPVHFLAFGFGSGLAPFAPGSFGTLAAVPLWLLLRHMPLPLYAAVVAILFALGCWLCGASARALGVHDYGGIVFDEIVGFLATCIPLLPALAAIDSGWRATALWTAAAFALFRLFDIWKPWPISTFDRRLGGGFGIMLDDLLAAVYAGAILAAAIRWHIF